MATRKIKISQLTELVSASLNTTIVGVDNGITYRMDLDTVADTLTSKVNISDRSRISALEAETGSYLTSLPNDVVSGSDQLTSSYDSRYILSGSITQTTWDNVDNKPIGLVSESTDLTQLNSFTESIEGRVFNLESATGSYLTSLDGTISSSQQITDFGFISESAEIPLGTISGSSQLTSSFDTRYTLSGSVQPLPNGLISGSSQLTSSYDSRYLLSSSYSTDSASFNSRFDGLVTTGSNTFSGSQVFSGSMTVTSGQVIASTITNNSSSLFLQSGSNLYVQNDGLVEITGSLTVNGISRFETVGGDEGGEIEFGIPQTNTTLVNSIKVDVWRDRLRIFEGSNDAKGVFIDLSKAPSGVGAELLTKSSGFVDRGVDVTLGNLKARLPSSGNVSLQLSTISGTYAVYGSDVYSFNGIGGGTLSSPITITTTPTYLNSGHNFTVTGATDTWNIMDTSAGIAWRITMILGSGYLNNFISIERLH